MDRDRCRYKASPPMLVRKDHRSSRERGFQRIAAGREGIDGRRRTTHEPGNEPSTQAVADDVMARLEGQPLVLEVYPHGDEIGTHEANECRVEGAELALTLARVIIL